MHLPCNLILALVVFVSKRQANGTKKINQIYTGHTDFYMKNPSMRREKSQAPVNRIFIVIGVITKRRTLAPVRRCLLVVGEEEQPDGVILGVLRVVMEQRGREADGVEHCIDDPCRGGRRAR